MEDEGTYCNAKKGMGELKQTETESDGFALFVLQFIKR